MPTADDGQQAEVTNERLIAQGLPMKNKASIPTSHLSTPSTRTGLTLSRSETAARAEALWRDAGCPQGRDDEFWLEAERQLGRGNAPLGKGISDPNAENESLAEEVEDRFPDDTGKEPTSL
jgi:hypothetical protein